MIIIIIIDYYYYYYYYYNYNYGKKTSPVTVFSTTNPNSFLWYISVYVQCFLGNDPRFIKIMYINLACCEHKGMPTLKDVNIQR